MEPNKKQPRSRRIFYILLAFPGLAALPYLLILLAGYSVDRRTHSKFDPALLLEPNGPKKVSLNIQQTPATPINSSVNSEAETAYWNLARAVKDESNKTTREEFRKAIEVFFPDGITKNGRIRHFDHDPLSDEQARWLESNPDLPRLIHEFIRAGAPTQLASRPDVYLPHFFIRRVLACEFRLYLRNNDFEKARETLFDIHNYAVACGTGAPSPFLPGNHLFGHALMVTGNILLTKWINKSESPRDYLIKMAPELERMKKVFNHDLRRTALTTEYNLSIREYIQVLQKPWKSVEFGWDVNENWQKYYKEYNLVPTQLALPRIDRIFLKSYDTIQAKKEAQEFVSRYKTYWQNTLNRMEDGWPGVASVLETPLAGTKRAVKWTDINRYSEFAKDSITFPFLAEAGLELNRAALELLKSAPEMDPARARETLSGFVDPFTGKPFHLDSTSTGILLYSLGPDMQDQQGLVSYNLSNGPISSGDIVISVPRESYSNERGH